MTVYGDAIEPHGGSIWLGSLIKLLEPFGVNERLIRTSVFRLTQEGWISATKVGRRSYYSLTERGGHRIGKTSRRLYASAPSPWEGEWLLAVLSSLDTEKRRLARHELEWLGFAQISPGLMASPSAQRVEVVSALEDVNALEGTILFQTRSEDGLISPALCKLVCDCWDITDLAREYASFIEHFRPVWQSVYDSELQKLDPESCFILRTILIHEYRKILLRDPQLPESLLPTDWQGRAARQLCRNLYRLVYSQAESWLNQVVETVDGPLPGVNDDFFRRFGGLL